MCKVGVTLRLVSIKNCRPGMRLARHIYNEKGLILLSENMELTENLLERLEKNGILYLYVHDERTEDIVVTDPISDQTRQTVITEIRTLFRKLMENNVKRFHNDQYYGKQFRHIVNLILDDLTNHQQAMMMLTSISLKDHYLFEHSMNVCIYTSMLGIFYGYTRDELTTLALGALLHDIGKTQIPNEILQKTDALSEAEMELMKKHTEIGYVMLKDEPNIPLIAAHCAYQHHERLNGSGYPRGITGEEIHEYAKWIAIVDSYDAMTSHRVYRKAVLPHQAMEALFAGAGTLYDADKLIIFRDRFSLYPLGVTVKLSTGETGIVVDINSTSPQRPVVRIIQGADGQELSQLYELDLSKHLNVTISDVIL